MKIVHLTDTYAPVVGGIERQIERLAALQVAQGHEVVVVSGRHGVGPGAVLERGVVVRRPVRPTHPGRALPLHADDMDADVFHAHLSVVSPGTLRAASLVHAVDLPLAVTVHSMWPTPTVLPATMVRLAGLDAAGVAWSAVSGVAAARVRTALSGARRVDVVPNAVDTTWWRNPAPAPARDDVHAVVVGRLARRKRVLPLMRALAPDWPDGLRVTIVGDGPQRRPILDLARRHGLADRIRLLGSRTPRGVRTLLHDEAQVFVAPSALESFGIAALEARAAGIPVLARRGTGVADFVRDGIDGRFGDSDEALASALCAFVAAPGQLRALAVHARHTPPPIDEAVASDAVDRLYGRALLQRDDRSQRTAPLRGGVPEPAARMTHGARAHAGGSVSSTTSPRWSEPGSGIVVTAAGSA